MSVIRVHHHKSSQPYWTVSNNHTHYQGDGVMRLTPPSTSVLMFGLMLSNWRKTNPITFNPTRWGRRRKTSRVQASEGAMHMCVCHKIRTQQHVINLIFAIIICITYVSIHWMHRTALFYCIVTVIIIMMMMIKENKENNKHTVEWLEEGDGSFIVESVKCSYILRISSQGFIN